MRRGEGGGVKCFLNSLSPCLCALVCMQFHSFPPPPPIVDTLSGCWAQTFRLLLDTSLSFRWDLERQIMSSIPHLEAVQDRGAASSEKYTNMWDKVHTPADGNTEFLTLAFRIRSRSDGLGDSTCKYLWRFFNFFFSLRFTVTKAMKTRRRLNDVLICSPLCFCN